MDFLFDLVTDTIHYGILFAKSKAELLIWICAALATVAFLLWMVPS